MPRAPQQEYAGHAEALVDEWHRTLRARLGNGLCHEGRGRVSAGQLPQHHRIGHSARRWSPAAVQAFHLLWGARKGALRAWPASEANGAGGRLGKMRQQGGPGLGHLLRECELLLPSTCADLGVMSLLELPPCSTPDARNGLDTILSLSKTYAEFVHCMKYPG